MGSGDGLRRIVVLRTDRLGETVLSLPVAAAIKRAYPTASIAAVVRPDLGPLVGRCPEITSVLPHPAGPRAWWWARALRLAGRLRRGRFDAAVVLNPMKELHVAVWLAGIPRRLGYGRKWGGLLTDRVADRKALGGLHEVQYNLDVVRALGVSSEAPQPRLASLEPERSRVARRLAEYGIAPGAPFIAVHPGTSNPAKRWPPERFRRLMERAATSLGAPVVVVGGAEEREVAQAALPRGVPVVNLTGALTLVELAAVLQRARLLVSNDSGPVHVAALVGTRALVLFGGEHAATGPQRWGPWGTGHIVLAKASLDAVTVDDAVRGLEELWHSTWPRES